MDDGQTPLDEDEAADLLIPLLFRSDLNAWEQEGIERARRWAARSTLLRRDLLTLVGLRRLHLEMFRDIWRWAGKFRTTEKNIGVPPYRVGADLLALCDDAHVWIGGSVYEPTELVTRFHHRLVLIHPFPNGNGRWARLASDQLCINRGWELPDWGMRIEGDVERRAEYLAALRLADARELEPLQAFLFPASD